MHIGEEVTIRPLQPYPQIMFFDGTEFRDDGAVLRGTPCLGVRVPALQSPARLILQVRCIAQQTLTVSLDDAPPAEHRIKNPGVNAVPVTVPPGKERMLMLRFKYKSARRSREMVPEQVRVNLCGVRLEHSE